MFITWEFLFESGMAAFYNLSTLSNKLSTGSISASMEENVFVI